MNLISMHGKVPLWRIALWSLVAMAGVNYLGKPEGHPLLGWLYVLFAGAFITGYCLYLNWTQTDRVREWLFRHPGLVRGIRAVFILPLLVEWLLAIVRRRRR
jgi:drug/metabolite transporter (DMT)-like permease